MILLDTNACIAALNGRLRAVAERVASAIVSVFELWCGIAARKLGVVKDASFGPIS